MNIPTNKRTKIIKLSDYREVLKNNLEKDIKNLQDNYENNLKNYDNLLDKMEQWFLDELNSDKTELVYEVHGSGYYGTDFKEYDKAAVEQFRFNLIEKGYQVEVKEITSYNKYYQEPNPSILQLKVVMI
jgi:ABC-type Zn uptake system ZnuABC Zn-binding protein ZnuA